MNMRFLFVLLANEHCFLDVAPRYDSIIVLEMPVV